MSATTDEIRITYPVQRSHVQRVIGLLGKTRRTTRRFYRFLIGASLAFAITLALSILVLFLQYGMSAVNSEPLLIIPLCFVSLCFVSLAAMLLIIAFLSSLLFMGIQWCFSHRLGKIGLGEVDLLLPLSWRARTQQIVLALSAVIGVTFIVGAVSQIYFAVSGIGPDRSIGNGSDLTMIIAFFVIGLLLTVRPFISNLNRYRNLLVRINGFEHQFSQFVAPGVDGKTVDIPVEDLNLIARMEAEEIERERSEAIADARRKTRADNYILLNSRSAMDAMGRLQPEIRVRVRELAAELTQMMRPEGATWDGNTGTWRLVVPGTGVQLSYLVDKENLQIKILSVENPQEESSIVASGD